jgi:GNAT superfamily N-acetyltransferase
MTVRSRVRVRDARPGDLPVLVSLVRELADYEREPDAAVATEEDFRAALFGPTPRAYCYLTEDDSRVTGFALWYLTFSTWTGRCGIHLEDLYVRPECRRRGHGHALIQKLAQTCISRGYRRLEWEVLDWNRPAISFYDSLGATSMLEWTKQRLAGEALLHLASRSQDSVGAIRHQ